MLLTYRHPFSAERSTEELRNRSVGLFFKQINPRRVVKLLGKVMWGVRVTARAEFKEQTGCLWEEEWRDRVTEGKWKPEKHYGNINNGTLQQCYRERFRKNWGDYGNLVQSRARFLVVVVVVGVKGTGCVPATTVQDLPTSERERERKHESKWMFILPVRSPVTHPWVVLHCFANSMYRATLLFTKVWKHYSDWLTRKQGNAPKPQSSSLVNISFLCFFFLSFFFFFTLSNSLHAAAH